MAPLSLHLTPAVEELRPRITTAVGRRGVGPHLPLLLFPRVTRCPDGCCWPSHGLFRTPTSVGRDLCVPPSPPGFQPAPGEWQRKETLVHSTTAPFTHRSCYAGTQFFNCRGKTQGRRGHRFPPDRFAQPPYLRTGGTPVRPSAFSFGLAQREENLPGASF